MITRPLNLASHLRPPPRNLDYVFYVNACLIGLFFMLFGSPFVVSPGMALALQGSDLKIPALAQADAGAVGATHRLVVGFNGLMIDSRGIVSQEALQGRLEDAVKEAHRQGREPVLLILGDAEMPVGRMAELTSKAVAAGFKGVWYAANPLNAPQQ